MPKKGKISFLPIALTNPSIESSTSIPIRSKVFSLFGNAVAQRNNLIFSSFNALMVWSPTCSPHTGTFVVLSEGFHVIMDYTYS